MTEHLDQKTVRAWRESRYLSMQELAKAAGLSVQTIWSIENGKRHKIAYRTLRGLASALGIEPSQITIAPAHTVPPKVEEGAAA